MMFIIKRRISDILHYFSDRKKSVLVDSINFISIVFVMRSSFSNGFLNLIAVFLVSFSLSSQTIYYSKPTGNLNLLATWGLNTDGTGASPLNFTSVNCTYVITNTTSATIAAAWAVSGAGSKVQLGDGLGSVEFVVPTTAAFTGSIDVLNSATLSIYNTTIPTMGALSAGSTVRYLRVGAQNVAAASYYNLIIDGTGQKSLLNTVSAAITNSLVINSGNTFRFHTVNTLTATLTGSVSGTGAIIGNVNSNLIINGAGNLGTLTFSTNFNLRQLTLNRTPSGLLSLGSNLTIANSFIHSNGQLNLNGRLLTLNGAITFPAAISNGAFVGSSTSSLTINASTLAVTNPFYIDQTNPSTRTLSRFAISRVGQTFTLGSDLIVENNFVHTACLFDLNNRALSIGGIITFPTTVGNGYFIGSASASLSILGAGAIGNTLKLDQTNFFSRNLNAFNVNHTGGTLTFGSSIYCDGAFVHTNGPITIGANLFNLSGSITFPLAATNGSFTGSATSSLTIEGTGSIVNSLFVAQTSAAARTLNNLLLNRVGQTLSLGNNLSINTFSQTNGRISLGSSLLTLSGEVNFPATITNGYFIGSSTSSLAIGLSTAAISNPLFFDQTTLNDRTLNQFTINRAGQTLVLANDLVVASNFVHTNGIIDINDRSFSINGVITFPAAITNGYFIGSPSSSLSVGGFGAIGNALRLDQTDNNSRSLGSFFVDQTGGTLTLGNDIICASIFTHNNGPITLGATHLTLNGAITFPLAASNGSFTGSATSSLTIGGSGSITNSLFMSQANVAARTMSILTLNRLNQTLTLGNPLIVNSFSQTNGRINLGGTILTLNGEINFPTTVTNGYFIGSPTSSLAIGISTAAISSPLLMDQTSLNSRTLNQFTINRVGQTIVLGNDLVVASNFVQTNAIININNRSLSINGIITLPVALVNGYFIGSPTSSLSIGGVGAITNALRLDQTNANSRTLNSFIVDQTGGTLTLGNDIICAGVFTHNNGPIAIGATNLTLNGAITFPVAASNGSLTGSATSSITIAGSGVINNSLFVSQVSAAARTFNGFVFNRSGQTLVLGNPLITNNFSHINGTIDLNGTSLAMNAAITFPASSGNGLFTGSPTSSITIAASAGTITNSLFMNQLNANSKSLSLFTMSRIGQTLTLGNDLTVQNVFTQTAGLIDLNGSALSVNGIITFPTTVANGVFIGSATSSLTIGGVGAINNTLKFDQTIPANRSLHTFSINQSGGTLTFGSSIICENNFIHNNGPISIGANLLTLNGDITFPVTATNGSFTGSATSSLSIEGAGTITNPLFMSQASAVARTFNAFVIDRASQTLLLGNPLIANVFTQTNGSINLNNSILTLNGIINFPANITNGSFIGSTTSTLVVGGTGIINNTLKMEQSSAANRSLYDLTMSRPGQTLSIGNALEIRNALTPTSGNITTDGFITLKADASRSAMLGVVGGVVSGNLNVENYAPGSFTGWTNLGTSGITGLTVADWESQIIMTCSGCPYGPNSAGGYFVSIQSYSETLAGSAAYVPLSYTTALTRGIGYWVYLGTSLYTTTPISYSFTGPPATGNVIIPVTVSANSGFNLVANPYPAPIDWDLVAADLANVNLTGAVYVYNPDLAQTVSYAGGVSNPSGYMANGIIPMGQGFYVQAILGGNVTFRESHKSNQNTNANPLLKPQGSSSIGSVFRLSIQGNNEDYDETAIRFHTQATDTFDNALDAVKIFQTPGYKGTASVYSKYTSISTRVNETDYSINSLSQTQPADLTIPVLAKAQSSGAYTISPIDIDNFDPNACVILRDKLLNVSHDLRNGAYVCTIADTTSKPRFELQICTGAILEASFIASVKNNITIGQEDGAIIHVRTQFSDVTESTISVYSIMGQKIQDDLKVEGTENSVRLNLESFQNQLVILKVNNNKGQTVKKVYLR